MAMGDSPFIFSISQFIQNLQKKKKTIVVVCDIYIYLQVKICTRMLLKENI